jgi:hypothetical protein
MVSPVTRTIGIPIDKVKRCIYGCSTELINHQYMPGLEKTVIEGTAYYDAKKI